MENFNLEFCYYDDDFGGKSPPSKFLNAYDFGMKMYTSKPITAQRFFHERL